MNIIFSITLIIPIRMVRLRLSSFSEQPFIFQIFNIFIIITIFNGTITITMLMMMTVKRVLGKLGPGRLGPASHAPAPLPRRARRGAAIERPLAQAARVA